MGMHEDDRIRNKNAQMYWEFPVVRENEFTLKLDKDGAATIGKIVDVLTKAGLKVTLTANNTITVK